MNFDIVIHNGRLVEFDPDRVTEPVSIGIIGDKIAKIYYPSDKAADGLSGGIELDASGKIIAPGFIDFHSHIDGKRYSAESVLRQGATTTIGGGRNFDGKTNRKISVNGFLINQGFFISHSFTLRKAMGIRNPYEKASAPQIKGMCMLAEKFLESGFFGIHFGLEFVPGTTTEEIVALAELARSYDRVVVIHLRKDGFEALDSIREIIDIADRTDVSIHILHLMYMVGFPDVMEKALEMIDEGIERGLDLTADTTIYTAFPSCIGASILDEGWEKYYGSDVSEKNLMISSGIYAGERCTEETFSFLRQEFPNTLVTVFVLDENQIYPALRKPYVYVSTNAADGHHYENVGHPATAGTFAKLIHEYVKKKKILSLPGAVRKITYDPAARFGIRQRGEIKEGNFADLVLFDDETIADKSDFVGYGDPNMPPSGIEWVIVNGKIVFDHGMLTGVEDAGKLLY